MVFLFVYLFVCLYVFVCLFVAGLSETTGCSQNYYNTTLLPSINTLIARGMFCGSKYTHHTFTPIIKHLITTANKHSGKKSLIEKT